MYILSIPGAVAPFLIGSAVRSFRAPHGSSYPIYTESTPSFLSVSVKGRRGDCGSTIGSCPYGPVQQHFRLEMLEELNERQRPEQTGGLLRVPAAPTLKGFECAMRGTPAGPLLGPHFEPHGPPPRALGAGPGPSDSSARLGYRKCSPQYSGY
ncbi:unnamed protein product [Nesidiocoris tenuis]|uniref:Uncharacterized protein n=1 Tax=Nesidiocoris tenuis TaxID=355587 RepID=A0A6H5GEZ2_9HEMI|nr:unnamed protein product [Nesidiocoris tenuis]